MVLTQPYKLNLSSPSWAETKKFDLARFKKKEIQIQWGSEIDHLKSKFLKVRFQIVGFSNNKALANQTMQNPDINVWIVYSLTSPNHFIHKHIKLSLYLKQSWQAKTSVFQ